MLAQKISHDLIEGLSEFRFEHFFLLLVCVVYNEMIPKNKTLHCLFIYNEHKSGQLEGKMLFKYHKS